MHHDFRAHADNIAVAPIMRDRDAEHRTFWSVNFHIGAATSDGCLTRQDAIQWVEHQFALFLAGHAAIDPQEWPHDQRSAQLRFLKQSDPSAWRELVEDLRAGRVECVQRKK